ncbi:hypothetical protein MKW92_006190 [Papaver armeniacum]|nr:hypothetical protein MKW92_038251 [Papaver armeniacum]KAI3962933.1 hypothetical protein MKW92_006190 [Papaver armeniacum]
MSRGGGVGITNAVNVGIAVQADWENRRFLINFVLNNNPKAVWSEEVAVH